MKQDLIEMEHMIDEYLAFARGEGGEQAVDLDIAALVREAAEGARRTGAKVAVTAPAEVPFRGRRSALKRAFANLIGNAVAHGQDVGVEVGSPSVSTTMARASPPNAVKKPSGPSTASMSPGTRTPRESGWAWPSPGTPPAATAATSGWRTPRLAGCAPPSGCRAVEN
jgi:hypothetical protein